jgi:hypothetical protein
MLATSQRLIRLGILRDIPNTLAHLARLPHDIEAIDARYTLRWAE